MSVSKWSYNPEKCDGDYCPGKCDYCTKASFEDGMPIWMVLQMMAEREEHDDTKIL